jgi:hypothetical protein
VREDVLVQVQPGRDLDEFQPVGGQLEDARNSAGSDGPATAGTSLTAEPDGGSTMTGMEFLRIGSDHECPWHAERRKTRSRSGATDGLVDATEGDSPYRA